MATNSGAPTGLDLSACSVIATGDTASQTLAALGKSVADNATAVATVQSGVSAAQSDATQAQTNASKALATAGEAQTGVSNLNTTTIKISAINSTAGGGVLGVNSDGSVNIPLNPSTGEAIATFGSPGNPVANTKAAKAIFYHQVGSTVQSYTDYMSPASNTDFYRYLDGVALTGRSAGSLSIGTSSQPVNTVYSQNAAVVTSDATLKTVAGKLGDVNYADGQKLVAALATVQPAVYQLNASIAEKGAANARLHVGYIAQEIEAAITAAGLDPAKYAMWTKSDLISVNVDDDGIMTRAADADASGNQKSIQMLRYEEIFPVVLAGLSGSIASLTTRVSALEAKAGA